MMEVNSNLEVNYTLNDTYSDWDAQQSDSAAVLEEQLAVAVPVVFTIIGVLGIAGNALVFLLPLVYSRLYCRNENILLANVALTDIVFVVLVLPYSWTLLVTPGSLPGDGWCKMYNFVRHVTCYVRAYTLVTVAVDRYLAVVHPVDSRNIRQFRYTLAAIACLWGLALLGSTPLLFQYGEIHFQSYNEETRSICVNIAGMNNAVVVRRLSGSFFVLTFLFPLLLIFLAYGLVARYLLTDAILARGGWNSPEMKAEKRSGLVVFVVVSVFAVLWTPHQAAMMVKTFGRFPRTLLAARMDIAFMCMAHIDSCVNPIIYVLFYPAYRRGFHDLLRCVRNPDVTTNPKPEVAIKLKNKKEIAETEIT